MLSQSEMGSLLGLHAVTIHRWETHQTEIGAYHAALLDAIGRAAARWGKRPSVSGLLVERGPIYTLAALLHVAFD